MPFDGVVEVNRDVRVIDKMLELFGPDGEGWGKGYEYRDRKLCLRGALKSAKSRLRSRDDRAGAYILYQIAKIETAFVGRRVIPSLEHWNDYPERTFFQIREMLAQAKELAIRRPDMFGPDVPSYYDLFSYHHIVR
jgi:hypothetical protein